MQAPGHDGPHKAIPPGSVTMGKEEADLENQRAAKVGRKEGGDRRARDPLQGAWGQRKRIQQVLRKPHARLRCKPHVHRERHLGMEPFAPASPRKELHLARSVGHMRSALFYAPARKPHHLTAGGARRRLPCGRKTKPFARQTAEHRSLLARRVGDERLARKRQGKERTPSKAPSSRGGHNQRGHDRGASAANEEAQAHA